MYQYFQGLYMYTATCNWWMKLLHREEYCNIIFDSLDYFRNEKFCTIYGFVIMPNHLHFIIGLDESKKYKFQLRFAKYTAQQILRAMKRNEDRYLPRIESTQSDRDYHFWERRPHWGAISTEPIFWQKLSYIHRNPLQERWKLVEKPEDYKMSSAMSYLQGESLFPFLTLWE